MWDTSSWICLVICKPHTIVFWFAVRRNKAHNQQSLSFVVNPYPRPQVCGFFTALLHPEKLVHFRREDNYDICYGHSLQHTYTQAVSQGYLPWILEQLSKIHPLCFTRVLKQMDQFGAMDMNQYFYESLRLFPERPGEQECSFFVRTGTCRYGLSCKYHHPLEKSVRNSVVQVLCNINSTLHIRRDLHGLSGGASFPRKKSLSFKQRGNHVHVNNMVGFESAADVLRVSPDITRAPR